MESEVTKEAHRSCNSCGALFPESVLNSYQACGHYGSTHLLDGHGYKFTFCELCLRKLFDTFKVPPMIFDAFAPSSDSPRGTYAEDKQIYIESMWRQSDAPMQRCRGGLCNQRMDCMEPAVVFVIRSGHFSFSTACAACQKYRIRPNEDRVVCIPYDSTIANAESYEVAGEDAHLQVFEQWIRAMDLKTAALLATDNVALSVMSEEDRARLDRSTQDGATEYEVLWIPNQGNSHDVTMYQKYAVMTRHDVRVIETADRKGALGWIVLATHVDVLRTVVHGKIQVHMW